jgi:REP element-mobilizing transposase RayT
VGQNRFVIEGLEMILGYHIILGTYGFWLPNDPRGSYSKHVWSPDLAKHGPATTVKTKHSRAADPHDIPKRLRAKRDLKFPEVFLSGVQAQELALGIGEAVSKYDFQLLAFAILEQHIHCVARSSSMQSEAIVKQMKRYAGNRLSRSGKNPLASFREENNNRIPSVWARGFWKRYIDSEDQLLNTIRYVEQNPIKEGKRAQYWSFVSKNDDLPHT